MEFVDWPRDSILILGFDLKKRDNKDHTRVMGEAEAVVVPHVFPFQSSTQHESGRGEEPRWKDSLVVNVETEVTVERDRHGREDFW